MSAACNRDIPVLMHVVKKSGESAFVSSPSTCMPLQTLSYAVESATTALGKTLADLQQPMISAFWKPSSVNMGSCSATIANNRMLSSRAEEACDTTLT